MTSIRLLPIVVLAASALLVLKTVGLVTGGGYTLSGVQVASAQDAAEEDEGGDAEGQDAYSAEDLAAAEAAAAALFESTPESGGGEDISIMESTGGGGAEPLENREEDTEALILQRLAERRAALDALAAELDERLAVVEAAEMRVEERMSELAEVEARINAMVDAQEAAEDAQFAAVVAMYEAMRPKDAARIFNDIDMSVLVDVGRAMNPRKLGPIMAEMMSDRAQELTVRLAGPEDASEAQVAETGFENLPQIVGE
ncbi:MotE family protein [Pelagibacterium halotolerans]|uniref:MotE family protein n=1 Tax=Pelagibacterium halotolerans TaxID=531813 RepID=UPI003850F6F0